MQTKGGGAKHKPRQQWPNQSGMEALIMSDCPQAAGEKEINVGN